MDTGCQTHEVAIVGGGQDATVRHPLPVDALEVTAVVRQHGPTEGVGTGKDIRVGSRCPAVLLGRRHIVTEASQFLDDGEREVFIGTKATTASRAASKV